MTICLLLLLGDEAIVSTNDFPNLSQVKTKLIEEVVKRGTPSKEMEVAVRIEQLEKVSSSMDTKD